MGRGYGITPPAYWLLAAWHWSETGKPAYRGRYEYAKAWLLFMIKAYLIWKWEQARWLKEHWVVGQKEKKKIGGRNRERGEERRETPSNPHRRWGVETGMSQSFSNSSETSVEHCRFDLFGLQRSFSLLIRFVGFATCFYPETTIWLQVGSRTKTDRITSKSSCAL